MGVKCTVEGPRRSQDFVVLVLKLVPMGWTHALWVGLQSCHETIVDEIPRIACRERLVDTRPAPGMDPFVRTEHVALSQKPGLACEIAEAIKPGAANP